MHYDCRIEGDLLVCTLTPDRTLRGAVFCCSGMAPMAPVLGGTLARSLGSYTEIALPDLAADAPHVFHLRYTGGYTPANRAWMPLGPYLRDGEDIVVLPPTPAGRMAKPRGDSAPLEGLSVVPQPDGWVPTGQTVDIDGVKVQGGALRAVTDLADRQGMSFRGSHPVTLVHQDLPKDAYSIAIARDGITIGASGYDGQFYAGITLLTLLQHGPLPCGDITDTPRFEWRGQHLDTARHYFDPTSITALLDLMALLKLNRFHWHFADDEAFRIELDTLPELATKTALRGEGQFLPALFGGSPCEGGSYPKDTVRDIIAHATALNIEVMPEIETPAHALAVAAIYPDTRDPGDNGQETSVQGYQGNAMNPAMAKSWQVWEAMIDEISDLFPFDHLHLGCDELAEDTWMSSPRARALMAEHGLETTHDLQGWTIEKLAAYTARKGKRPAAWEEAAQGSNGGIGNNATLFSWTGQGPGLDAARAGYDVVMTPAQHVYLDMAHTDDPNDWGASWAAFVDLPDTIAWDPVPDPALVGRIIGVQGAFWSEFTTQDSELWPMIMPRMLGVAMMAWQSDPPNPDVLKALSHRYSVDDSGQVTIGTQG
ncbi:beta-N-acetylhexosaminidase [Octadecabacter sp. G9-8]|uniref:beta-N-acetylhexosaminidase n=1 Tax=Octadecabacter dasysiphoniae TaxID=2909341 RepID=A0ABS9CV22_9RHOB|nr:family 20 glycosylhydrolase [Octadecabacter dasysiphoniae]MCF2870669.1 beta-N-acetylhexosaminidase [Octadecabacter dasysiphoniae]